MSGFVVCQSCGTRIKAGRGHCLRCFEPLPDPDVPLPTPLSVSLGLSRNTEIMVGVGAALAVGALVLLIWQTWPVTADDTAQPAGLPAAAAAPASPADPASAAAGAPADAATPPAAEPAPVAATAPSDPDLETTRAEYERQLADAPKDAVLLNKLGQLLERMGRSEEAAVRFERAIAVMPLEPAYRLNLARAAVQLRQWDRAINQYREVMRLRPKDYDTLTTLGATLQKKGDDQGAVAEFQRAAHFSPSSTAAALGLAMTLEKVGRVDEAIAEFRRYLELGPSGADAERVRGHLALLTRGRPQVK